MPMSFYFREYDARLYYHCETPPLRRNCSYLSTAVPGQAGDSQSSIPSMSPEVASQFTVESVLSIRHYILTSRFDSALLPH
jgi:hypothetical protein